jgi:hypothetical protein
VDQYVIVAEGFGDILELDVGSDIFAAGHVGRWPLVVGLWSLAFGRWPLVVGLWSLAFGRWPFAARLRLDFLRVLCDASTKSEFNDKCFWSSGY